MLFVELREAQVVLRGPSGAWSFPLVAHNPPSAQHTTERDVEVTAARKPLTVGRNC